MNTSVEDSLAETDDEEGFLGDENVTGNSPPGWPFLPSAKLTSNSVL